MMAPMIISLDLKPDVEAQLTALARARGVSLKAYVKSLIKDLARRAALPPANGQQLRATLDALAEMGRNLPELPPEALSRESIYRGHN